MFGFSPDTRKLNTRDRTTELLVYSLGQWGLVRDEGMNSVLNDAFWLRQCDYHSMCLLIAQILTISHPFQQVINKMKPPAACDNDDWKLAFMKKVRVFYFRNIPVYQYYRCIVYSHSVQVYSVLLHSLTVSVVP